MINKTNIQQQKYCTLNNVLNNILNNIFNKVLDNITMTIVALTINETFSLSFFNREYRATNVAPMLINKNMDMPCTYEGRTK